MKILTIGDVCSCWVELPILIICYSLIVNKFLHSGLVFAMFYFYFSFELWFHKDILKNKMRFLKKIQFTGQPLD